MQSKHIMYLLASSYNICTKQVHPLTNDVVVKLRVPQLLPTHAAIRYHMAITRRDNITCTSLSSP